MNRQDVAFTVHSNVQADASESLFLVLFIHPPRDLSRIPCRKIHSQEPEPLVIVAAQRLSLSS
jgi:hypothetical protein